MTKILLALTFSALATSAFAQATTTTTEYYIVQDATTKKCTIVDKKPTTTTTMTVVGNSVYKTRAEAESGMKTVKICTSTAN